MLGNEAIARGAYEAGITVSTAYPGTPSTEITEYIAQYREINAEWSINEKVAFEIAMGAAIAGARAMVSMKHVGLNVAADPFMSISYPGVNGALVVVVADDPGQHSSQNEQDTRYFGMAAKVPVLEPTDAQECKDFILAACEMSEQFDTPVIVRLTTRVAHARSVVSLEARKPVPLREFDRRIPGKYIVAPFFAKQRRVVAEKRLVALRAYADTSSLNTVEDGSSGSGIITGGMAYHYAREVMPDAGFLKLGMSYPLPENLIRQFAQRYHTLFVVEELEPIWEEKIKSWGIRVTGKEVFPTIGELSTELVRHGLTGKAVSTGANTLDMPLPQRPPVLCPGCHHRGPFYILKKLKMHVAGDIGCYTLAAFPPFTAMDTSICMGASLGMAFGFEKARGPEFAKQTVAVIGDSTFWHSGVTGLIDIVYNRGFTTVIILDNSVTAMTGHQENPSTGFTLDGKPAPILDFKLLAQAIGIRRIREVDAYNLKEFEAAVREETAAPEPSLIITKRVCVLRKNCKDALSPPLVVDAALCSGCRKCLPLGCPALSFGTNKKAAIDEALCTGCGLCADVCDTHAITRIAR